MEEKIKILREVFIDLEEFCLAQEALENLKEDEDILPYIERAEKARRNLTLAYYKLKAHLS